MTEEIKMVMEMTKDSMDKSLLHLDDRLAHIRAGKADARTLDGIMVDYYGSTTALSQVSNINTPDARTIKVQPWEKNMIDPIEKAIMYANLGLNPMNNGESILINVPPLTEERRKDLVKQAKAEGEHSKVSIRNARKDAIDQFKQMKKDGLSEDMEKDAEAEVQSLTVNFSSQIDEMIKKKEVDIMTL
ncbi:MAG: ribosome recycling factor [Salinivirgaceae bacterium]|jgi:ribosome recycling factor|nr:ribosome recycling factor [Salinivirgaceae bacterium]